MADADMIQTPADDNQPTNIYLHHLQQQQQVTSFFQTAGPQQRDALESFFTMFHPMSDISNDVIPPTEEARIRLGLAKRLQSTIPDQVQQDTWCFTASHLSAILVMPIDILREVASSGRVYAANPPPRKGAIEPHVCMISVPLLPTWVSLSYHKTPAQTVWKYEATCHFRWCRCTSVGRSSSVGVDGPAGVAAGAAAAFLGVGMKAPAVGDEAGDFDFSFLSDITLAGGSKDFQSVEL